MVELSRSDWAAPALPWFATGELLAAFGGTIERARRRYRSFVEEGVEISRQAVPWDRSRACPFGHGPGPGRGTRLN